MKTVDFNNVVASQARGRQLLQKLRIRPFAVICVTAAFSALLTPLAPSVAEEDISPIFGVRIPTGYRQWPLVAPSNETGKFDEIRSILGNTIAIKAYRDSTLPFPDGAILVKLAWKRVPSAEFSGAFVPGHATTVQIMVKDSRKYDSTGGWGFGRFIDGIALDRAQHDTCFPCHRANVRNHDYVYTRFAP